MEKNPSFEFHPIAINYNKKLLLMSYSSYVIFDLSSETWLYIGQNNPTLVNFGLTSCAVRENKYSCKSDKTSLELLTVDTEIPPNKKNLVAVIVPAVIVPVVTITAGALFYFKWYKPKFQSAGKNAIELAKV